ncbi:MAG TPA: 4-hydroxybenzoate 3-monooxygenase [Candidatus Baltobacteraceae bacterium]|nr:4-hydroxybenzoate 3-monooxygenase [Candidatus Baltobacteraceae bacterium]
MSAPLRTQVAIIGAGPAGLMLAHLLHRCGIESVVVESRSRNYVESRVRAGVLEHGTAELLNDTGAGERMRREGLVHRGIALRFDDCSKRIDFPDLTGGKTVTVYGQQEVVKDLIAVRLGAGGSILFECEVIAVDAGDDPSICYRDAAGAEHAVRADFVAGCDGFHGVARAAIPPDAVTIYDHAFPFGWLGILAETPPVSEELIYVNHARGFALVSMRSRTISRMYLQCRNDEDLGLWPDERIWAELRERLGSDRGGPDVRPGKMLQKGVTPMRSFVCDPMRYGRLFLAGDSAHIVPPTGAKGMNLAIADVYVLAEALDAYYGSGETALLDAYSQTCLRRVWKTQRFSSYMTRMLHRFDGQVPFDYRVQLAELDYVTSSRTAAASLAENYVGLPFESTADLRKVPT